MKEKKSHQHAKNTPAQAHYQRKHRHTKSCNKTDTYVKHKLKQHPHPLTHKKAQNACKNDLESYAHTHAHMNEYHNFLPDFFQI